MTGFELCNPGARRDWSANCALTTGPRQTVSWLRAVQQFILKPEKKIEAENQK